MRNTTSLLRNARALLAIAALAVTGAAMAQNYSTELIEKGRYLATASDCIACHTATKDKPMAGGHAISSPVGEIVATNITPSKTHGIGNYTEQQFSDALRKGVRADGARLYPAMPYTAFARLTNEDVHALYAYFMEGVKPVDESPKASTSLPFPMNVRASMIGWNLLFADDKPFEADAAQSAQWNRGAYLAQGPGHCMTCHTPRGALMQELGSESLSGAQIGAWWAPDITNSKTHGIGSWSVDELTTYLRTGHLPGKAQAAGPMAEAITHSFSRMTESDLRAISTYILSVPSHKPEEPAGRNRFAHGQATDATASFRGTSFAEGMKQSGVALGSQIFTANCASCHGASGQGTQDGYYPALFGKSITGEANPSNLIAAILSGVDRETPQGGHVFMPPFGGQDNAMVPLNNDEVAALSNFLLTSYGNPGVSVTAAQVQTIREGGEKSSLILLARVGMAVAAVILLLLIVLIARKRRNRV
ncbi:c-type cytochrome [Comamonas endophytica]|uniref:Cytochrome c n=1 Tax=Comamonas endophytica TaxID=2949090 RepID=A0ABY6GAJ5_9BURK|nr:MULTISPECIES: cytochrome c [unclassified Acidovorax]MCD2514202.1 cytochrome c [Acidovorax sp. D4N7]UYG51340.1 cytochrome c [Acidovorax sp. 5MLIR]